MACSRIRAGGVSVIGLSAGGGALATAVRERSRGRAVAERGFHLRLRLSGRDRQDLGLSASAFVWLGPSNRCGEVEMGELTGGSQAELQSSVVERLPTRRGR